MSALGGTQSLGQPALRVHPFVARHGLVLGALGFYLLVAALALPQELVQDSWLTLVSGREVAQHGLPHHDVLFAWTHGRTWIDQQWLGQLLFYGLASLGGIRLVLAAHLALLAGAAGVTLATARGRASSRSVFLVALVCLLAAPWGLQLRAQTVAELLFALVLALLVDEQAPAGGRFYGLLALLVLWANVHGTVVLGAGLAMLRGATLLRRAWRRGVMLLVCAPFCTLVSPYGFELVGYYHRLLANPLLPRFLNEWRASTPSRATAPFYVVLVAAAWLVARHGRKLGLYERLVLAFLALSALDAIRSIVWFALAAAVVLPEALDDVLGRSRVLAGRGTAALAAALLPLALLVAGTTLAHGRLLAAWPRAAADAAAAGHGRVFAGDRFADWLLWERPDLRGRIAYDVRFELFDSAQFHRLAALHARDGAPAGYAVWLGSGGPPAGARVVYRSPAAVVAVLRQRSRTRPSGTG